MCVLISGINKCHLRGKVREGVGKESKETNALILALLTKFMS